MTQTTKESVRFEQPPLPVPADMRFAYGEDWQDPYDMTVFLQRKQPRSGLLGRCADNLLGQSWTTIGRRRLDVLRTPETIEAARQELLREARVALHNPDDLR